MIIKIITASILYIGFFCHANNILYSEDIKDGDVIFWSDIDKPYRAGHIAVVNTVKKRNSIEVIHSTDNPKYNALAITNLPSTNKVKKHNKKYTVIRIQDLQTRKLFLSTLRKWSKKNIKFAKNTEIKMNKWDDSLVTFTSFDKVKIQKLMFELANIFNKLPHKLPASAMCTEIILLAMQNSYYLSKHQLPKSIKLIPDLCPPSVMITAMMLDHDNFRIMGILVVRDYDA